MDKTQEIKKALEAATPGRWHVQPGDHYDAVYSSQETMLTVVASKVDHVDANLIANAPEWLSYLLTELDAAREMIRFDKVQEDGWRAEYLKAQAELDTVKQENERMQIQAGINVDLGSALSMSQEEIESLQQQLRQAIERTNARRT